MRYATFASSSTQFDMAVLSAQISLDEIRNAYLTPFGLDPASVIVYGLHHAPGKKKTPAAEMKEFIATELVPELHRCAPQYVLCNDAEYFKILTKTAKVDAQLGYVLDCAYGPWKVVYVPSYRTIFYDPPKVRAKIAQAMEALCDHARGNYSAPGSSVVEFEFYPNGEAEIKAALDQLLAMNVDLTSDIEAFSLKHYDAGIGSISFAWDQHSGIAFLVDYEPIPGATQAPYGKQAHNGPIRALLKDFFTQYMRKLIWHNISYDVYVLIYQLWMKDLIDTAGLLEGMDVMLDPKRWEDTKLITYLATNSCAGNKLGLKDQAQEFAGNYAETDIEDITLIPPDKLLRYNLVDALSTWYVHNKHWNTMVADQQEQIYQNEFKNAIRDIVQMQLTGMPLNQERVAKVRAVLEVSEQGAINLLNSNRLMQAFTHQLNVEWVVSENLRLKTKKVDIQDADEVFNPNSPLQLQKLLYGYLELPILNLTDTKQPSVDGDTLELLVNHTKDKDILELLGSLLEFRAVNKILTSFIPAFEAAPQGPDGWWYLFGNFNLGGTLSGRLSSNNPNLQNLPANVMMAVSAMLMAAHGDFLKPFMSKGKLSLGKLIKWCFQAPPGWTFAGLDFALMKWRRTAAMQ